MIEEEMIEGNANGPPFVERDLESQKDLLRLWNEKSKVELKQTIENKEQFEEQGGLLVALLEATLGTEMDEMIDILEETFFNEIEATGDIPFFDDTK
jgi:ribosome maturation factor RimP